MPHVAVSFYRRFESAAPNARGAHPGVFAMANGLAATGALSASDLAWWRAANDRATSAYADPSSVQADCYDRAKNPGARAWFRESAGDLVAFTHTYLTLLGRYDIRWRELRTEHPGRITYEDAVQVVAVPLSFPDDWPFTASTRG